MGKIEMALADYQKVIDIESHTEITKSTEMAKAWVKELNKELGKETGIWNKVKGWF